MHPCDLRNWSCRSSNVLRFVGRRGHSTLGTMIFGETVMLSPKKSPLLMAKYLKHISHCLFRFRGSNFSCFFKDQEEVSSRSGDIPVKTARLSALLVPPSFFFLCCRIALDCCGQVNFWYPQGRKYPPLSCVHQTAWFPNSRCGMSKAW